MYLNAGLDRGGGRGRRRLRNQPLAANDAGDHDAERGGGLEMGPDGLNLRGPRRGQDRGRGGYRGGNVGGNGADLGGDRNGDRVQQGRAQNGLHRNGDPAGGHGGGRGPNGGDAGAGRRWRQQHPAPQRRLDEAVRNGNRPRDRLGDRGHHNEGVNGGVPADGDGRGDRGRGRGQRGPGGRNGAQDWRGGGEWASTRLNGMQVLRTLLGGRVAGLSGGGPGVAGITG